MNDEPQMSLAEAREALREEFANPGASNRLIRYLCAHIEILESHCELLFGEKGEGRVIVMEERA